MHYVDYELDEDYCFRLPDGGHLEIPFYGRATIRYCAGEGDWQVIDVALHASKGRVGQQEDWLQPILTTDPLFRVVCDYLEIHERERVQDMIRDDIDAQRESYLFDQGKEIAKMRRSA